MNDYVKNLEKLNSNYEEMIGLLKEQINDYKMIVKFLKAMLPEKTRIRLKEDV